MKQIKDVDKLKDIIEEERKHMTIGERSGSDMIENIIDSLAVEVPEAKPGAIEFHRILNLCLALVEVPEAKPGAIEEAIQICEQSRAESIRANSSFSTASIDRIIRNARAELAQLQAELLDYKTAHPKMQLSAIERTREIKIMKGALRTLAVAADVDYLKCCVFKNKYYKCNIENCTDCKIAYALANPTEEVEDESSENDASEKRDDSYEPYINYD